MFGYRRSLKVRCTGRSEREVERKGDHQIFGTFIPTACTNDLHSADRPLASVCEAAAESSQSYGFLVGDKYTGVTLRGKEWKQRAGVRA